MLKALPKDVEQRYPSARAFADALPPWAPSEALVAPATPPTAFLPVGFIEAEPPSAQAMVVPSRGAPPSTRSPRNERSELLTQFDPAQEKRAPPSRGWLLAAVALALGVSAFALGVHKKPELAVPSSLAPLTPAPELSPGPPSPMPAAESRAIGPEPPLSSASSSAETASSARPSAGKRAAPRPPPKPTR
jgi:hypothetical protein